MKVAISGKQLEIGAALKAHVQDALAAEVEKYFGNAQEAHVVLSRQAHLFRADIAVHVGHNILVQGHAEADAAYPAFDLATQHVGKRLRRYKRRLRDHSRRQEELATRGSEAQQYILAAASDGEENESAGDGDKPVVIAELTTIIATMTVSEAVMRLDLAEAPAMLFHNSAHGGLNLVYRRPDGNIGWIDPHGGQA
jgi:ribosomal subunit interface protein